MTAEELELDVDEELDDFDYGDDEDRDDGGEECAGCGDWAEHLSSDGLCDGCVIFGPPRRVITARPLERYL